METRFLKRAVMAASRFLVGCAAAMSVAAWAQDYPSRPVKLIVPFTAGGLNDHIARVVAQQLGSRLDQQVIVENRPGAGGLVGTAYAIKQPADGYTLVLGSVDSLVMGPVMRKKRPYDAATDLTPIALFASSPLVAVARADFVGATLGDLVASAKSRPGQISYGSAGVGTSLHLGVELLQARTGTKMLHVPFHGGTPMMQAMAGGHIDWALTSPELAAKFLASGHIKALAQADVKRFPLLPDVQTAAEQGMKDFVVTPWFGVVAPPGLPRAVVERLEAAAASIGKDPGFRDQLINAGARVEFLGPSGFRDHIAGDLKHWSKVVEDARIPLQD